MWANRGVSFAPAGGQLVSEHLAGDGSRQRLSTPISGSEVQGGIFSFWIIKTQWWSAIPLFTLYNDSAKELAQRQHSFSSPVLRTDGSLAVVYHQEGTGIRIESASETLTSRNLEQKSFQRPFPRRAFTPL